MAFCHRLRLGHFAIDFHIGILPMPFSSSLPYVALTATKGFPLSPPRSALTEVLPNDPVIDALTVPDRKEIFGHPRGLWVLVLTEGWVAFSLYGLQSILVLYLADHLLQPGHIENVWGMGTVKAVLDILYAPVGIQATAGAITGLFLALIYATPLLGGFVADRLLGKTRTILLGAILMTVGHVLMSFDWSFVLAVVFLLLGIGAAGGLRAQVGALYALDDRRRSDAYQIYSLGVQAAVIVSPALCGMLAMKAWHWGFLTAGLGMLTGLIVYLFGRRWLPEDAVFKALSPRPRLTSREKKTSVLLLALLPVLALGALPNDEIFDGYLLWGREHYQLTFFGHLFPVSSLVSFDGFISTLMTISVLWFWRMYARHRPDPAEITKVAIGTFIASSGPAVLALASWLYPESHQISLFWGLAFHIINDIGFSMSYAIGMAMYSRAAPVSLNTIFVACFSLHLFMANLTIGKLSTLIGRIGDVPFWLLHSGTSLVAGVILLTCSIVFRSLLAPENVPSGRDNPSHIL